MRTILSLLWFIAACVFAAIIGFATNSPVPPTIALTICVVLMTVETLSNDITCIGEWED
jgi:hypothetical protein